MGGREVGDRPGRVAGDHWPRVQRLPSALPSPSSVRRILAGPDQRDVSEPFTSSEKHSQIEENDSLRPFPRPLGTVRSRTINLTVCRDRQSDGDRLRD
jgi:hypothetical protein